MAGEFSVDALARLLTSAALPSHRLLMAYSGGLDSTALLHALAALRRQIPGLELNALHVHHGLQPAADAWTSHCEATCRALRVPIEVLRTDVRPEAGESLEMAARRARYAVLAGRMRANDVLVTAHHADDQLETVLLRLLRGSGPHGLAGMRDCRAFAAGVLWRPLLGWSRDTLLAHARQHGLAWVDDPSNADTRHDRNFLRAEVLPALRARWPAAAASVGRSARLAGETDELLLALASTDAGVALEHEPLPLGRLRGLSPGRQRNVLRQALLARGLPLPSQRRLEEARRQLIAGAEDRNPVVAWRGAEFRRYRNAVYALSSMPAVPVADGSVAPGTPWRDALGEIALVPCDGAGTLPRHALRDALTVAYRRGGEKLAAEGGGRPVALSDWLGARAVPPWWRDRVPLLFARGELVAVADVAVAAGRSTDAGDSGWRVRWRPEATLGARPPGLRGDA